ncbi:MAG: hypothetical protein ACTSYI_04160 [Promethearchaeota archaeon]
MAGSDNSEEILHSTQNEMEELRSYKYLLGDFGVAMLTAVMRGAENGESIQMLSGVPHGCITGRMPVLLNLKLLEEHTPDHFKITSLGLEFLKCIKECF